MRKAPPDVPSPNLHWDTTVAVRDPEADRADALESGRGLVGRTVARLRQLARFFYTLLTET
jgi:hypothetical protein